MESLSNQFYSAPLFIANAVIIGKCAYEEFREKRRNHDSDFGFFALYSLGFLAAVGMTGVCIKDGLEKIL